MVGHAFCYVYHNALWPFHVMQERVLIRHRLTNNMRFILRRLMPCYFVCVLFS